MTWENCTLVRKSEHIILRIMKKTIRVLSWCLMVGVISYALLLIYAMFCIDSTRELQRGTILGELLLTSRPIRSFPNDLIHGEKHYFYATGEPSGRSGNIILIRVKEYDSSMAQKCMDWLSKNGFVKTQGNTANTLTTMMASDGREAKIEVSGNDIVISVEH